MRDASSLGAVASREHRTRRLFLSLLFLFPFSFGLNASKVVEDGEAPDSAATFQRRGGRARRYWGKVNRGIKNFRRRRARRRGPHAKTDAVARTVSVLE